MSNQPRRMKFGMFLAPFHRLGENLDRAEAGLKIGVGQTLLIGGVDAGLEQVLGARLQGHQLIDDVLGVDSADQADTGGDSSHGYFKSGYRNRMGGVVKQKWKRARRAQLLPKSDCGSAVTPW